jgi:hypothetical protein
VCEGESGRVEIKVVGERALAGQATRELSFAAATGSGYPMPVWTSYALHLGTETVSVTRRTIGFLLDFLES